MEDPHYSSEDLIAYYCGELAGPEADDLRAHIEACETCLFRARRAFDSSGVSGAFGPETYARTLAEYPVAVEATASKRPSRSWWEGRADVWKYATATMAVALAVMALLLGDLSTRYRDLIKRYRKAEDLIASLPKAPPLISQLHDRAGDAGLTPSGAVRLPVEEVPPEWLLNVKKLFNEGRVAPSAIVQMAFTQARTAQRGANTRGTSGGAPLPTTVMPGHPFIRWTPVAGAKTYILHLGDANQNAIWASAPVVQTEIKLPAEAPALKAGRIYSRQVETTAEGKLKLSDWVSFPVLDSASVAQVTRMEQQFGQSAVLMAAVYEAFGLYDDAEAEIGLLATLNPGSTLPANMLRSLRELRAKE